MKRFLALLVSMFFFGLGSLAKTPEVVVLPLFVNDDVHVGTYSFDTTSEIVASELSYSFNRANQIVCDDFNVIKSMYQNDLVLKGIAKKYQKTGLIDFESLVKHTQKTSADYILLTASYVVDKNNLLFDAWDVLKISGDFDVDLNLELTTKIILVDKKDGIVVWQKTYLTPLGSKNKPFVAKSYLQATEQYQKVSSYLKNIVARDVEHNLMLKFYPKQINFSKNIKSVQDAEKGIGLKYYKKMVPLTKITQPSESFEQQLLKEDSFSL